MAGLPVAMKCGYSGMDVALVEEGLLGGTCLNRGCIPTKTMLRSAEVANPPAGAKSSVSISTAPSSQT